MGREDGRRHHNEQRCRRLLDRSALLDTSDLDWAAVGTVPVAPQVLRCLVYMRDVEGFTDSYVSGLAAHPRTLSDPLLAAFLAVWQREEAEHARAIDRYLVAYAARAGTAIAARQPAPAPDVGRMERFAVQATRPIGGVVTTAHMVWGAANELLTMHGYRLLARRGGDPVLAELLGRIAAQESRHYGFYLLQAEWRLEESRLARSLLPLVMTRWWTPVGIGDGYKTRADFDDVLGFLAAGEEGRRAITRMDATFARLPGFVRSRIFSSATPAPASSAPSSASSPPPGAASSPSATSSSMSAPTPAAA